MIIFNWIGFGLIAAYIAILSVALKFTQSRPALLAVILLAGAVVAVLDIFIRRRSNKQELRRLPLLHPRAGGHLFFVPVWILLLLLCMAATVVFLRGNG